MSNKARLERLEREASERPARTGTASVLITDADGAEFLATLEGEGYGSDLVITTGVFKNHAFTGGLTAAAAAAIAKLNDDYETVAVHRIDGYHLRLCDEAYRAALARAEGADRVL